MMRPLYSNQKKRRKDESRMLRITAHPHNTTDTHTHTHTQRMKKEEKYKKLEKEI